MKFKKELLILIIIFVVSTTGYLLIKYNETANKFEGFDYNQLVGSQTILPTNEETVIISAPRFVGKSSKEVPYYFNKEMVEKLENLDYVTSAVPVDGNNAKGYINGTGTITNYISQVYEVSGELAAEVNYDTNIDLEPLEASDYLSDDELAKLEENNADYQVSEVEYASLIVPTYPYQVLINSTLGSNNNFNLLMGSLPENNSNQLLVPDKLAYMICEEDSDCNKIDSLIGTDYSFTVSGDFKAAVINDVTITGKISGIYSDKHGYNNIITSYDENQMGELSFSAIGIEDYARMEVTTYLNEIGSDVTERKKDAMTKRLVEETANIEAAKKEGKYGTYPMIVVTVKETSNIKDLLADVKKYDRQIEITTYKEA